MFSFCYFFTIPRAKCFPIKLPEWIQKLFKNSFKKKIQQFQNKKTLKWKNVQRKGIVLISSRETSQSQTGFSKFHMFYALQVVVFQFTVSLQKPQIPRSFGNLPITWLRHSESWVLEAGFYHIRNWFSFREWKMLWYF